MTTIETDPPYPTIRAPLPPTSVANVLLNETPFNMDIINMIMDFNKPHKFEVGKTYRFVQHYVQRRPDDFDHTVIKRSRCYITYIDVQDMGKIKRNKIHYHGDNEYIYTEWGHPLNAINVVVE